MSDTFLSRWSRRKRGAEGAAPSPAVLEAPQAEGPGKKDTAAEAATSEGEIIPEELAQLPSLDDLTAETDFAAFLRRGVPQALRNAALRRAWALDPKIRDFVCEAREYAYDWNVPGGVPGSGELQPTDDVAGMIRQIFGEPPPEQAAAGEASPSADLPAAEPDRRGALSQCRDASAPDADHVALSTGDSEESASQQNRPERGILPARGTGLLQGETDGSARPSRRDDFAAAQVSRAQAPATPSVSRRHGRATPI